MRYRRLTKEEFEALHEEFILFLSANTITGEDWKKIKEEDIEKADKLMDIFSDIVIDKVLQEAQYLERYAPGEYMCVHYGEKAASLMVVRTSDGGPFEDGEWPGELENRLNSGDWELLRGTKEYSKLREQEMFELMQQNATPAEGKIFKAIMKGLDPQWKEA